MPAPYTRHMHARGYMLEVEYDGQTLTAEGTTKAARIALRGAEHDQGPLILNRADITQVDHKPASALTNGRLTLHTAGGRYVLHFRRKQAGAFTELAAALEG